MPPASGFAPSASSPSASSSVFGAVYSNVLRNHALASCVNQLPDFLGRHRHVDVPARPSGDSASTTEFTTAGEQPMVPASPTPFTPSGFTGDGVIVWLALDPRHHVRARHRVIHQLAGDKLAVVVIDGLLPQRLAEPLRDAAVHLPVDDQRIQDIAAIVHRDVAPDLNLRRYRDRYRSPRCARRTGT